MIDAVTLAAVADELNEKIVRGRVQAIVPLDPLSFGFEVYAQHRRHYLYASVHPEDARIHLVAEKLRGSGAAPAPLLLLLHKYADGAFIVSIAPIPHERVLRISFDHPTEGLTTLVVETIGRYSNLILVDAGGMVVDALKRVGPQVNRARVVLPKHPYAPPPPQSKLDPGVLSAATLARALAENRGQPLWQVLVKSIAGVSPLLAREVAFRSAAASSSGQAVAQGTVMADPAAADAVDAVLSTLMRLSRPPWEPSVAFEAGEEETGEQESEPAAFAPYALTHYPAVRSFDSISAAIEAFYGASESFAAAKEPLRAQLNEARERLARKRTALAQSLPSEAEVEQLRTQGELVLAYASAIVAGASAVTADTGTGTVEISLDPKLTPVENAQEYFKRYRRAKDASERVPPLLAEADADVAYADQMLNDLDLAEDRSEIDAVVVAAREAGLLSAGKGARRQAKKTVVDRGPRVVESRDGFTILVGKNARQNEEITFRRAEPDDLWLHARSVPGAHVVILRGGREIPESTVREAAELAAQYSQARSDSHVDVIVTARRNVRRVRGGRTGMVTVAEERTYHVKR